MAAMAGGTEVLRRILALIRQRTPKHIRPKPSDQDRCRVPSRIAFLCPPIGNSVDSGF